MDSQSVLASTLRWIMVVEMVTFVPLALITGYVVFTMFHTHILHLNLRLLLV